MGGIRSAWMLAAKADIARCCAGAAADMFLYFRRQCRHILHVFQFRLFAFIVGKSLCKSSLHDPLQDRSSAARQWLSRCSKVARIDQGVRCVIHRRTYWGARPTKSHSVISNLRPTSPSPSTTPTLTPSSPPQPANPPFPYSSSHSSHSPAGSTSAAH